MRRHRTRSSCRRGGGRGAKHTVRRGGARNTTRDSIEWPYDPLLQNYALRSVTSDLDLPLTVDPADLRLVQSLDIDLSRAEGNQTRKTVMQGGKRRTRRGGGCCKRGRGECRCAARCGCRVRCGCVCVHRRGCGAPTKGGCGCGCGCGGGKACRCGSGCGCGCPGCPKRRRRTRRKQRGGAPADPLTSLWWDVQDTFEKVGSAALGSPLAGRVRGIPKFIGKQIDLAPKWLPGAGR